MQVLMRGKRIGVEQVGKSVSRDSLIAMPDDSSAVAIIRFIGDDVEDARLKTGIKIYFGKNYHQLRMNGMNILVMDEDNVYAIVEDAGADEKKASS